MKSRIYDTRLHYSPLKYNESKTNAQSRPKQVLEIDTRKQNKASEEKKPATSIKASTKAADKDKLSSTAKDEKHRPAQYQNHGPTAQSSGKGLFAAAMITAPSHAPTPASQKANPTAAKPKQAEKSFESGKKERAIQARAPSQSDAKPLTTPEPKSETAKERTISPEQWSARETGKSKDKHNEQLSDESASPAGDATIEKKRRKKQKRKQELHDEKASNDDDGEEPECVVADVLDRTVVCLDEAAAATDKRTPVLSVVSLPVVIWGPRPHVVAARHRSKMLHRHKALALGSWVALFLGLLALGTGVLPRPRTLANPTI